MGYVSVLKVIGAKVWAVLSNSAIPAKSPPGHKVYFQETLWDSILLQAPSTAKRREATVQRL